MKKQNYQLRIVITQGKEVLAEVKMRRDALEDLPNVPSLPGTIYNMIGDLCRLQAASAETDEPTANEGDAELEPEPETLPTKTAADPTPPSLPTKKHLTPASAPRGKGLPPKKMLYHFTCKDCGGTFTVFGQYRDGDTVKCSSCGSTNEFKDSFASFDAYCGHVYGRTNSEDTEMVWTCRCRNDLILTWSKKLRKYTNGGK
jgi:ribosomal protein S27E